jgi:hypothetical protein
MVLNGKQRKFAVADPLDGSIVQVQMSDLRCGGARHPISVSNHCESMVLRRDQHLVCPEIPHRMITAAMAVRQLGGGATVGQADQLMTETNPEGREPGIGELPDTLQRVAHGSGIARTIGKKETVGS